MLVLKKIYHFKEFTVLLLTVFLSLFLFFNNQSPIVEAVKADIADIAAFLAKPKRLYQDLLIIRGENQSLKESLVQLQLLNAQLIRYKNENESLREMLQFSEESPMSLKPCSVVDLDLTTSVQSIIADIGSTDNIVTNLPVMDMQGLIGKVTTVGKNACSIQLITDKNFRVSIRVGKERTLGIFSPTHGNFGELDGIQESVRIQPGEIAYTSGISDIYPPDIPVAKILNVKMNSESGFQDVSVEIIADIYQLNYIFVIQ